MSSSSASVATGKGEQRRRQLLQAAAECFRREGFHGSSIARISQAAGMSPGHIYHYFPTKESMVEAIAEWEQQDMAELMHRLEHGEDAGHGDLGERLTRHTAETIERTSDPAYAGLRLELAAEAGRNPAVRKILEAGERATFERFYQLILRLGPPAGLDAAELRTRLEMIAILLSGITMRSLLDSGGDREALVRLTRRVTRFLLEDAP